MSSWSFRLVHHKELDQEWYAVHEVYYGDDGKPHSMTEAPVTFVADSKDEMIDMLIKATRECQAYNVLEASEIKESGDEA